MRYRIRAFLWWPPKVRYSVLSVAELADPGGATYTLVAGGSLPPGLALTGSNLAELYYLKKSVVFDKDEWYAGW